MLFAAHESFHIRQGWLRKGLRGIEEHPDLFSREDATDVLGVGRNMVSAIRYWLQATGLTSVKTETADGKRTSRFDQTEFARLLMKHDPFIEDEGSLWFIHYELATNLAQSTTWSWFFNRFGVRHFTQDMFLAHLQRFVDAQGKRKISSHSLEKDFRCFVRTYSRSSDRVGHLSPEENFDCPLSSLNLLEYLPRTKSYRTLTPDEGGLPELLVAYALMRMRSRTPLMSNEISFRDALYAEEYFRLIELSEEDLFDEPSAVAGLELVDRVETVRHKKTGKPTGTVVDRYRYPAQEMEILAGDDVKLTNGTVFGKVAQAVGTPGR